MQYSINLSINDKNICHSLPGDIDLFTGGLIEKTVNGALLGATLECLIGEQFKRLKYGDRFWFQSKTANYNQSTFPLISSPPLIPFTTDGKSMPWSLT
jgi:hypothetical protein